MATMSLPVGSAILMALSLSGAMLNDDWQSLTVWQNTPFILHLKETEFRFNHRRDNLYLEILKLLRLNPL